MELGQDDQQQQQQQVAPTIEKLKIKITFDEYQKIAVAVVECIQRLEEQGGGQENIMQKDIVDAIVKKFELEERRETNISQTIETTKKIQNVIQNMITKENILLVTEEAKTKNDRRLAVSLNVDVNSMGARIGGGLV